MNQTENGKQNEQVYQDHNAHVESVITAEIVELNECLSKTLSRYETMCVRNESDALKVLLAGIETRFREEHTALFDVFNAHTAATTAQTALLEALCREVRAMSEKVDVLCSHTGRLGHIERDVSAISKAVQGVATGVDAVSSFLSSFTNALMISGLAFNEKANEVRTVEEAMSLSFFWKELESNDGTLCQRPQAVDGEDKGNDRLRQHG